ncbi:MAG: hypothetical protein AAGA62_13600, partial [Bacteroidota bacterium]
MLSRTFIGICFFFSCGMLLAQTLPFTRGEVTYSLESVDLGKELRVLNDNLFVPTWHWVDPERDTIVQIVMDRLPFGSLPTASIGHYLAFNSRRIASPEGFLLLDTLFSTNETSYSPRVLGNDFVYLAINRDPP